MPRDSAKVFIGAGTLYTAPLGEAFPADPDTAPAGNWIEIGYSDDGWLIAFDRTVERVFAAEEINALVVLKTGQETHVRGTLLQATLENLELSFGGGAIATSTPSAGFRTYTPPLADEQDEFTVLFRSNLDGARTRDWQFPRTLSVASVEIPHNKAPNVSVVAMDFEAVVPSSGSLFAVVESDPV